MWPCAQSMRIPPQARKRRLDRQRIPGVAKSPLLLVIFAMVPRGAWRGASLLLYLRSCIRRIIRSSSAHVWRVEQFLWVFNCHPEASSTAYDVVLALELVIRQKVKVDVCMCCFFLQNGRRMGGGIFFLRIVNSTLKSILRTRTRTQDAVGDPMEQQRPSETSLTSRDDRVPWKR